MTAIHSSKKLLDYFDNLMRVFNVDTQFSSFILIFRANNLYEINYLYTLNSYFLCYADILMNFVT